jgi:hypothetical protein
MSPTATLDVLEKEKMCCFFRIQIPNCPCHSIVTLLTVPLYSQKYAVVILYPLTLIRIQNNSAYSN